MNANLNPNIEVYVLLDTDTGYVVTNKSFEMSERDAQTLNIALSTNKINQKYILKYRR